MGIRQEASREVLLAALNGLGVGLASEADAESALQERQGQQWRRMLEPVAVAWTDRAPELTLRLPEAQAEKNLAATLRFENGETQTFSFSTEKLPTQERFEIGGEFFLRKKWRLPAPLLPGFHHLSLETPGQVWECRLIAAPREAYLPAESPPHKHWGLFIPLYALPKHQGWGAGDFGDLQDLLRWTKERGGDTVSTLPFLASFLKQPCEPSPYLPVSRLFWNEFYLDISQIPELKSCAEARALLASPEFERQQTSMNREPLIDYRRQMALKRQVLEALQKTFFAQNSPRYAAFREFLRTHPQWEDYARFRAVAGTRPHPWQEWPEPLRSGELRQGDYDEAEYRYHLYVQWLAREQVDSLTRYAHSENLCLALDLPLGIHPQGYDAWREQDLFAPDVSVGAPPDAFFPRGQNWGFPPLLPEASRRQGHAYFRAALHHLLAAGGMLRIDHVMGFHRLFWIPQGFSPAQGCYLRYPAEEFYALLCLESQRSQTVLVGEDLGTVPPELRPALSSHGILRCYVAPFEFYQETAAPPPKAPTDSVASLNTHDMPTFAGLWQGQDLEDRRDLGLLEASEFTLARKARDELRHGLENFLQKQGRLDRNPETLDLLQACLSHLAAGEARWLIINLEDLWGETLPQNVPGTGWERPNWRRKAKFSVAELSTHPRLLEILAAVERLRKEKKNAVL